MSLRTYCVKLLSNNEVVKMSFGNRLQQVRELKDLSRKELAEKLKISYSSLTKYENDIRFPDQETLTEISNILDCSVDYLLGRTNSLKTDDITISFNTVSVDGLDDDEIDAVKNMIEMLKKKK